MKNAVISLFLFFIISIVNAQSTTQSIFTKTSHALKSLESIGYRISFTEKNPFSKGEISLGEKTENVLFNSNGDVMYKQKRTEINAGKIIFSESYYGRKIYCANLIDSTYTEEMPKAPVLYEMAEIVIMMERELNANPKKIIKREDTVYNGKKVYSFLIKTYDTVSNGNHDFTHKGIFIDKKTMLPVYLKKTGAGSASKGGLSLGRLEFYEEIIIQDVVINKKIKAIPFDTSGFSLPNTKMLNDGDISPELSLRSISGKHISPDSFKNKLVLVVFGAISCPANPLANPMLNRLHSKFSSPDFAIVNIYTTETAEQVQRYIESNNLKFPIYMGTRKLTKEFKTLGTPNFYLIGKDGKVVSSSDGYSKSLEADITDDIIKML